MLWIVPRLTNVLHYTCPPALLVPVHHKCLTLTNVLFGSDGRNHPIGCGDHSLLDVAAQQIAHRKDTGDRGLPFVVNEQAALWRRLKLSHQVIDDGLSALQVHKHTGYRQERLIPTARANA